MNSTLTCDSRKGIFAWQYFRRAFLMASLLLSPCLPAQTELLSEDQPATNSMNLIIEKMSYLEWMESLPGIQHTSPTMTQLLPDLKNVSLRSCMETALQNNFDIQNSRRDLLISQSNFREAQSEFLPFVTLNAETGIGKDRTDPDGDRVETHSHTEKGSVVALQNFATGGNIEAEVDSTRNKYEERSYSNDARIGITQPLLRRAGFRRGLANLRRSQLSLLSREIDDRLNQRDIILGVIEQYYNLLRAKLELQVSLDALEEKRRFLEATRIKFNLDQIPESEISRSEIQYLQERENVVSRRRNYEDQLERLLILLGFPLNREISVLDITRSLQLMGEILIPSEEECIQKALGNRLELMQSDIAIKQQKIALETARNDLLPDLDLSFQYATGDADEDFDYSYNMREENSWDANLSLKVPLPNIGRRESYKRSRISLDKILTDQLQREREIMREVKQAYRSVKSSESTLVILKRTVEQSRKSLEQELGRFDVGLSTSNDVRTAQDDLFEAQTRYFNELLNYQINIARLYKALGMNLY
ncbi:TolC family protein [Candidatus Sumerlaeota bacterium]|nr:TolC family protein [Candidatus Sumerlaeota bacterium]